MSDFDDEIAQLWTELADLKAQVEALNARVAQMEAAPSVPAGYSLLTIGDGQAYSVPGMSREEASSFAGDATIMSVLPTADAPAGATIEWNGYVRQTVYYGEVHGADDYLDLNYRGRLNMTARTDTAVGEVGVRLRFEADGSWVDTEPSVTMPVVWGWWAMTPELTLGGGYSGSLGNIGFGYDSCAVCATIDGAAVYTNPGDASQLRLTYASGPLSMAVALEDSNSGGLYPSKPWSEGTRQDFGVAGELAYAGDTFSGEISGVWRNTAPSAASDAYNIGAGIGFNLADFANISMAGTFGQMTDNTDYWTINALAHMNLTDEVFMEVGAGYGNYDSASLFRPNDTVGVMAGLYYMPVDQLTLGVEAEYVGLDGAKDWMEGGFVAIWSF